MKSPCWSREGEEEKISPGQEDGHSHLKDGFRPRLGSGGGGREQGISASALHDKIICRYSTALRFNERHPSVIIPHQTFRAMLYSGDINEARTMSGAVRTRDWMLMTVRPLDSESIEWFIDDILFWHREWF